MPAEGQKALLVIDVQNDFLPGGALAAPGGDRIIPVVNRLLDSSTFQVRVASADWHPEVGARFSDCSLVKACGPPVASESCSKELHYAAGPYQLCGHPRQGARRKDRAPGHPAAAMAGALRTGGC